MRRSIRGTSVTEQNAGNYAVFCRQKDNRTFEQDQRKKTWNYSKSFVGLFAFFVFAVGFAIVLLGAFEQNGFEEIWLVVNFVVHNKVQTL